MTKICTDIQVTIGNPSTIEWTDTATFEKRSATLSANGYITSDQDVDLITFADLERYIDRRRRELGGRSYAELIWMAANAPEPPKMRWKLFQKGMDTVARIAMEAACMDRAVEASEAFEASLSVEPWIDNLDQLISNWRFEICAIEFKKIDLEDYGFGQEFHAELAVENYVYALDGGIRWNERRTLSQLLHNFKRAVIAGFGTASLPDNERETRKAVLEYAQKLLYLSRYQATVNAGFTSRSKALEACSSGSIAQRQEALELVGDFETACLGLTQAKIYSTGEALFKRYRSRTSYRSDDELLDAIEKVKEWGRCRWEKIENFDRGATKIANLNFQNAVDKLKLICLEIAPETKKVQAGEAA